MRRLSRADVVQAMGTLGVRLSGVVERAHFDDAKTQALAGVRALLIESHPDRHAANGHARQATARAQEISAAEHLLQTTAWFEVAHLFAVRRRGRPPATHAAQEAAEDAQDFARRAWRAWADGASPTGSVPRGGRFYKRCPRCGRLTQPEVEHFCGTKVDPVAAAQRTRPGPRCGERSPMGVNCEEPPGHQGWHRGYGSRGRHTWRPWGYYADETVAEGDGT